MYSVTSFRTDATGIIYTCDWTYSNADGSVRGVVSLEAPVDNIIPVEVVTREIVTGWVVDVLPNTSEEFDAQIAADKARREAEEASVVYTVAEDGTYSV
jgi:phosphoribosylaminoimidazole-succinocarboxamide synthase